MGGWGGGNGQEVAVGEERGNTWRGFGGATMLANCKLQDLLPLARREISGFHSQKALVSIVRL